MDKEPALAPHASQLRECQRSFAQKLQRKPTFPPSASMVQLSLNLPSAKKDHIHDKAWPIRSPDASHLAEEPITNEAAPATLPQQGAPRLWKFLKKPSVSTDAALRRCNLTGGRNGPRKTQLKVKVSQGLPPHSTGTGTRGKIVPCKTILSSGVHN